MRYNFKRCEGEEWFNLIKRLRSRGVAFLEVNKNDLYESDIVCNVNTAYYSRTNTSCKIIYYDWEDNTFGWKKRLNEISFVKKDIDVLSCVLGFDKIASSFKERLAYEPNGKHYTNGVYWYFKGKYKGDITVLDMNSAYLHALRQPLADFTTKIEIKTFDEVWNKNFDYYLFENELHKEMFFREEQDLMTAAMLWFEVKIYGFKAKRNYTKTAKKLYDLKMNNNYEKYKNWANIRIGCMHKRAGGRNNQTLAASLYAWFRWNIETLKNRFIEAGYDVIMITTDSIKIAGDYKMSDRLVVIGDKLGQWSIEYKGPSNYVSVGYYEEDKIKWKGKPEYMREGIGRLNFIEDIEKEKKYYVRYAKV